MGIIRDLWMQCKTTMNQVRICGQLEAGDVLWQLLNSRRKDVVAVFAHC